MKIAMLSWESLHSIRVGGIAPHVSELAAALRQRGHEVHVYTRLAEGQTTYACLDGVHYHRCPFQPDADFVTSMERMSDSLVWHLGEEEALSGRPCDVVHGHDWLVCSALRQIKNDRRRPVAVTIHSTEYGRCGNELFWHGQSRRIRELEWESTYIANRVICVSESLRKEAHWLYSVPVDKTTAIYNGVDVRPFNAKVDTQSVRRKFSVGADDPCVLFAGRLAWQKGPDLLVDAIPGVLRQHPRTKFLFAGEGDMRTGLEKRAADVGGTRASRFVGYHSGADLIALFKTADVVCVPSRNEPFGIVILEAWSATKPVVATRTGGPAEFVRHGHTGLTVPTEVAAIGEGLDTVLSDQEKADSLGRNGRKEAETRFSWDVIAAQTEAVYLSILENGGTGASPGPGDGTQETTIMARTTGSKPHDGRGASARFTTEQNRGLVIPARPADAPGSTNPLEPSAEDISRRAYELYLGRNGRPGDPAADWLQAERELRQLHRAPKA